MTPAITTMPRLRGAPLRVFVSVDESTGRSTLSFAPAEVGDPLTHDDDLAGDHALATARAIVAAHPGCTIVGPHRHASARGRPRPRRGRR
jgi:hypothetical protein